MSEIFNQSVLDAINRAVQDGISTTALEVDGTPQYCIINAETREIEIPGELNIFGVESDEKSTRVYFRCPKYVGTNVDLDMTKCMVYVPYRNANGEKDQYIVTDLNETEDGENVEFTWLISRKASAYMGITEFGIRAIKTAVGGTIEAEWNTTVASANVIRGMDVGLLEFSEENTDALAQAMDLAKQEIRLEVEEATQFIQDLHGVEVTDGTEPYEERTGVWVDTSQDESYNIPEIDDYSYNGDDTWSSGKIHDEVSKTKYKCLKSDKLTSEDYETLTFKAISGNGVIYDAASTTKQNLAKISVNDGECYVFIATNRSYSRAWELVDDNEEVIDYERSSPSNYERKEYTVFIPFNAKYLYVSILNGGDTHVGEIYRSEVYVENVMIDKEHIENEVLEYDNIIDNPNKTLWGNSELTGYFFGEEGTQEREYNEEEDEYTVTITDADWTQNGGVKCDIDDTEIDYGRSLYISFVLLSKKSKSNLAVFGIEEKNDGSTNYNSVRTLTDSDIGKEINITIDLAHRSVYEGMKKITGVGMNFRDNNLEDSFTIKNFRVYQNEYDDCEYYDPILKNYLRIIDLSLQSLSNSSIYDEIRLESVIGTDSDGERYSLAINNGQLKIVHVVPDNIVFIGNSLLLGFETFGMAAQDSSHDYYHYITEYIKGIKPGLKTEKIGANEWESSENVEDANTWVSSNIVPKLDSDVKLVLIQLSDNVNTEQKLECFKESCYEITKTIRENAINARVAWVSAWYHTSEKQDIIKEACKKTGAIMIDITDLSVEENKNVVGNTYINSDGETVAITSAGVASHPNSRGMLAIANRILNNLMISDEEITDDTLDM